MAKRQRDREAWPRPLPIFTRLARKSQPASVHLFLSFLIIFSPLPLLPWIDPKTMAILPNKLFFRHLPDGYTRDDLAELAVDFGPVVQVDVPLRWKQDPKTGALSSSLGFFFSFHENYSIQQEINVRIFLRSGEWAADNRGCGFVTYASEADALNAMTTLNRLKVYRKTLTVGAVFHSFFVWVYTIFVV